MVPFRASIGANVDVDGERHMCSALLVLAGVSCSCYYTLCTACCGHPLQSIPRSFSYPGLQRRKGTGGGRKAVTRLARLAPGGPDAVEHGRLLRAGDSREGGLCRLMFCVTAFVVECD